VKKGAFFARMWQQFRHATGTIAEGLAISFALPTFAQQKDTVDPKIVQQIRVLAAKYDEAINRHDAAAVASLYTQDGVGQIPESKVSPGHGRQGIEKAYGRWFKGLQVDNYFTTVDWVTAVGNEIRSSENGVTFLKAPKVVVQVSKATIHAFLVRAILRRSAGVPAADTLPVNSTTACVRPFRVSFWR
jgi:SnoaL-like domain